MPAWSATVVVNASIDVAAFKTAPDPGAFGFTAGAQDMPPFSGVLPFSLAIGDTLDYTIDFVGSQTITITNTTFLWPLLYASSGGNQQTASTGSLQLLDAAGGVMLTSVIKTDTEGTVHIGQNFSGADFGGALTGPVTIGGLHYVGTVNGYTPFDPVGTLPDPIDPVNFPGSPADPLITSRDYLQPGFYLNAGSFVASVPEPGQWLLMLAGMGLLGVAAGRRSQR